MPHFPLLERGAGECGAGRPFSCPRVSSLYRGTGDRGPGRGGTCCWQLSGRGHDGVTVRGRCGIGCNCIQGSMGNPLMRTRAGQPVRSHFAERCGISDAHESDHGLVHLGDKLPGDVLASGGMATGASHSCMGPRGLAACVLEGMQREPRRGRAACRLADGLGARVEDPISAELLFRIKCLVLQDVGDRIHHHDLEVSGMEGSMACRAKKRAIGQVGFTA